MRLTVCGTVCRKVHLFDIDIPGKMTFKESLTLTPGEDITIVDTAAGRLGIGICYDIRFPELAMLYRQRGVQALVYPGTNMHKQPWSAADMHVHRRSAALYLVLP